MRKLVKNRKGFTLAEEVVTVLLIGILVASASGILLNAMRIFCQNVIMFNAQSKGIAVMEQLESHLAYAKTIGQQETETIAADDGCAHQVVLYVDTQDGKSELKEKGRFTIQTPTVLEQRSIRCSVSWGLIRQRSLSKKSMM